jgi:hypothetical protein
LPKTFGKILGVGCGVTGMVLLVMVATMPVVWFTSDHRL